MLTTAFTTVAPDGSTTTPAMVPALPSDCPRTRCVKVKRSTPRAVTARTLVMAPVSGGFRYGAEPILTNGLDFPGIGLELAMSGRVAPALRRRAYDEEVSPRQTSAGGGIMAGHRKIPPAHQLFFRNAGFSS